MNEGLVENLRAQIDLLDAQLVRILDDRMELTLRVRRLKNQILDAAREEKVLEVVARHAQGVVSAPFAQKLFREIMAESRRLQSEDFRLVGFQGEHGAYSEQALRKLEPAAVPVPCKDFIDVFEAVRSGQLDAGVVPVENSLAGVVAVVSDLLIEQDLHIVGEVRVPVHHCVCAVPETDYREIRVVYSHPMALAQCHGFISRNHLEPRPFYDTAGAAKMLASERPKAAAAIASTVSAQLYGLEILKENIEDHPSNSTRFVMLARQGRPKGGDKCSITFSTAHKSGALFGVLRIFSEEGLNLTSIESRPSRAQPGSFVFLVDFQGAEEDPRVCEALRQVQERSVSYKFLGCYPEARE
jgi:prephenate dehydratase/chorismate mutase/prephenate dehydratase